MPSPTDLFGINALAVKGAAAPISNNITIETANLIVEVDNKYRYLLFLLSDVSNSIRVFPSNNKA
jgi:hypothetical protein